MGRFLRRGGVQRGQSLVPPKGLGQERRAQMAVRRAVSHPVDLVRWYLPDITEVIGYGLLTENGRSLGLQHEDSMHFIMRTATGRSRA